MSETNGQLKFNWDTMDGATWASHDDSICRSYAGKWIVALPGKIIASGDDLDEVRKEAASILNLDAKTVVVQSIVHPDEWFKEYPHNTGVPAAKSVG